MSTTRSTTRAEKLSRTRFAGLAYRAVAPGRWRFVDVAESEPGALIGPEYRTKGELLGDLRYFAESRGYVEASI